MRSNVIYLTMNPIPPTLVDLETAAPELVRRLSVILMGLAALVAARFLRNPRLVGLIGPLWRRLSRIAGRVSRAMVARQFRGRASRGGLGAGRPALVRVPQARLWLVRELGWEAAGFGGQLEALLAEPEMRAVLAGVPAIGRIVRPICRMLGVVVAAAVPAGAAAVVAVRGETVLGQTVLGQTGPGAEDGSVDLPWGAGPQPMVKIGG